MGNDKFPDHHRGAFEGAAFSNHTALQWEIQSLLEREDSAEAQMALDQLQKDIPVSFRNRNIEKAQLLRKAQL